MLRAVLCAVLLLPLQTACGGFSAAILSSRSTRIEELRPDSPDAHLTCDGRPCASFRSTTVTETPNPWAFAAGALLEGTCAGLAASNDQRHPGGSAGTLRDVCAGLLLVDLVFTPLGWVMNGYAHRSARFDHEVELELNEEKVKLLPGSVRQTNPGVFSAEETLNWTVRFQRDLARGRLCMALQKRMRVRYRVLPLDGEDTEALVEEIQQQLEADLGPQSDDPARSTDFEIQPKLVRSDASVTLELRLLSGVHELGRWSVSAASVEGLYGRASSSDLYGAPCDRSSSAFGWTRVSR
jgi:hypothetical protein